MLKRFVHGPGHASRVAGVVVAGQTVQSVGEQPLGEVPNRVQLFWAL